MNTKILAIAVAAVVVAAGLGIFFLVSGPDGGSGGNGNDPDTSFEMSSDMLKGYRAELGGSVSLGIVNDVSNNATPAASSSAGPVALGNSPLGDQDNKKNRLVGIDGDDNVSEIWFSKIEVSDDGRPNVITQDDLNAQIDKLHVTKDFIYFSLTTHHICPDCHVSYNYGHNYCPSQPMNSYYSRDYYDRSGYYSDDSSQCFVIDRQSNNVYSLAEIPVIYYLDENLITGMTVVGHYGNAPVYSAVSVFMLTIENGELKATDMVPNKNIRVLCGMMNKDGTVIIANTTANAIDGNVVLCIDSYNMEGASYGVVKGSDGNVYKNEYELKVFDSATMQWVVPDLSLRVSIWTHNEYITTGNGEVYRMNGGKNSAHYSVWHYVTLSDGNTVFTSKHHNWPNQLYRIGDIPVCLYNGALYAYYTSSAATSDVTVPLADNIMNMEVIGGKVIAYEELVAGTVIHEVSADPSGTLNCNIVDEIVYDRNFFIIKPL